ncbi:MAG: hypothetical protein PF569_10040 [Candidatus Woesearchaeota archaeon]|jgi:predicted CopG family antitoxin|nr:hypothetical protein [Candidatus Woesearchaeota archaeon]
MTTTIQISEDLRNQLKKYKKSSKETYEDIIKELISEKENSKKNEIEILREGYCGMYGLSNKINDDFENLDLKGIDKNEY